METPIAIFVGLLLLCLVFSWLFGREDERHAQRRQHYQTLNDQDAAANTKRDRADAARRRNDPDAPENLFKMTAAQAKQQAALERQAYQLIRAEQRRQLAQARREEAAEKRRTKAQAARAKAKANAARKHAKEKREQAQAKKRTKKRERSSAN